MAVLYVETQKMGVLKILRVMLLALWSGLGLSVMVAAWLYFTRGLCNRMCEELPGYLFGALVMSVYFIRIRKWSFEVVDGTVRIHGRSGEKTYFLHPNMTFYPGTYRADRGTADATYVKAAGKTVTENCNVIMSTSSAFIDQAPTCVVIVKPTRNIDVLPTAHPEELAEILKTAAATADVEAYLNAQRK